MFKPTLLLLCLALTSSALVIQKRDASALVKDKYKDFKENCFPRGSLDGCTCTYKADDGVEEVQTFATDIECKDPVLVQRLKDNQHREKVIKEFKEKFGQLREGCFPRPKQGCRCNEKDAEGDGKTVLYDENDQCTVLTEVNKTMENKAKLNEEIYDKFGKFREECFPRPKQGCRCTEKDAEGKEITVIYNETVHCNGPVTRVKRGQVMSSQHDRPSQNVRDPVREKAQANYAAVVNELKEKFAGLREGCYPRPKGCLCVTGKDVNGREITQRYMKDSDCKCKAGSAGCPAAAGA